MASSIPLLSAEEIFWRLWQGKARDCCVTGYMLQDILDIICEKVNDVIKSINAEREVPRQLREVVDTSVASGIRW